MRLVLVRHGQTEWNRAGRWQGAVDVPLNQPGRDEAERLGQALAGRSFDLLVTSALQRARETAEILNRYLEVSCEVDPRLNEINLGVWEGSLGTEIPGQNPIVWQRWSSGDPDVAPEGGESRAALVQRVKAALSALRHRNFERELLVVSHKMTIEAILCLARNLPISQIGTLTVPNVEPIPVEI